jgi:hypothetical protein
MSDTGFLKRIEGRSGAQDQICRPPWHSLDFGTFATVGGKTQLMPENQLHCEVANAGVVQTQDVQSVSSATINGGQMQYYVTTKSFPDIVKVQWRVTIAETGGANPCTLVPIAKMIEQLWIQGQGGSTELQRVQGESIWLHNVAPRTTEDFAKYAVLAGETTNYAGGVAIAAGTTQTYEVDLPIVFSQADFYWGNVDDNVNVYIQLLPLSKTQTAGTGVPQIISSQLVFQLNELSKSEITTLQSKKNQTIMCRYTDDAYQPFNQAYAAGSTYDLRMDGLNGMIDFFWVTIRPSTLTGAGLYGYVSPGTNARVSLVDENGANINGGSPLSYRWARYEWAQYWPSALQVSQPILFWNFSKKPMETLANGSLHGFYVMNGRQYFRLTTGADFAGGNYALEIFAKKHSMLKVDNGRLTRLDS